MENKESNLEIFIIGQAGRIHCRYTKSQNQHSPSVIFLHPNPKQGGTINNKIIKLLENIFIENDFTTLAINSRGTEKTEGEFNPDECIIDAATTLDWLHAQNPSSSHYWVVGYSLGAWLAANVMMRRPEIEAFVLISPLINDEDFTILSPCPASGLIVSGQKDQFSNSDEIQKIVEFMNNQNTNEVEFSIIENANHTYKDCEEQLEEAVKYFINMKLATRISKPVRKKRRKRKKKDSVL